VSGEAPGWRGVETRSGNGVWTIPMGSQSRLETTGAIERAGYQSAYLGRKLLEPLAQGSLVSALRGCDSRGRSTNFRKGQKGRGRDPGLPNDQDGHQLLGRSVARFVGVLSLAERTAEVHVIMNNCYLDYAVVNARQMRALLDRAESHAGASSGVD
jgi:hypothetical protein